MTSKRITIECPECFGEGEVSRYQSFYSDAAGMTADFYDEPCERCAGTGEVEPDVTSAADMAVTGGSTIVTDGAIVAQTRNIDLTVEPDHRRSRA